MNFDPQARHYDIHAVGEAVRAARARVGLKFLFELESGQDTLCTDKVLAVRDRVAPGLEGAALLVVDERHAPALGIRLRP